MSPTNQDPYDHHRRLCRRNSGRHDSAREGKEYLKIISSETRRLSRLVRSMLDLSRLQSDERLAQQQFDVSETLVRTLVSLESKVNGKALEVDTSCPMSRSRSGATRMPLPRYATICWTMPSSSHAREGRWESR